MALKVKNTVILNMLINLKLLRLFKIIHLIKGGFVQRLGMVDASILSSNQIFDALAEWDKVLQHTSRATLSNI